MVHGASLLSWRYSPNDSRVQRLAEGDTSPKRLLLFGTNFPFVAQQFYSAFSADEEALLASSPS